MIEICYRDSSKRYVNPIFYWNDDDIWEFIKSEKLRYPDLYDNGFTRLGCLFCPLAKKENRIKEYNRYPGWAEAFRKAFRKLYNKKKSEGKSSMDRWKNGDEMFEWWINFE